jgi:lipopolysaccharide/colanic/teichoic acid biosynthesis glycosyltransferase
MLEVIAKRTFDIMVSAAALALLSPLLFAIALLIRLDSPGAALFRQVRVGRRFKPFTIFKFRTMTAHSTEDDTIRKDRFRITGIGQMLRRMKLDELPQLLNVLRGEMSLVGPRPELPCYVEAFRRDYEYILTVRPGITDLASMKYVDEESLLSGAPDPETYYLRHILPDKLRLSEAYVRTRTLWGDVRLLFATARLVLLKSKPKDVSARVPA